MTPEIKILEFFNSGLYNKAVDYYKQLDVKSSQSPKILNLIAACFFRLGEHSEADKYLTQAEPCLIDDPNFLSLYASNTRLLGNHSKSQILFEKAIKLDPNSLLIKNNYANLLIDQRSLDQAESLLLSILEIDPDYQDAKLNLNRVRFKITAAETSAFNASPLDSSSVTASAVGGLSLADPLLLAFASKEVEFAKNRYKLNKNTETLKIIEDVIPSDSPKSIQDKVAVARKALEESNYSFCLKVINSLSASFVNAEIYELASDAYLNLRKFRESEISLLNALCIGGGTPKRYLNLVSFASMRSDFMLAEYYLEKAASLDPSHPQLNDIRQLLVDKKKKSVSPSPFQQEWGLPRLQ